MLRWIDGLLNRITMYRLVLYYLIFLLGAALVLSLTGSLDYDPTALLASTSFLLMTCLITNWIFARTFHVPANAESSYISALILALIITPIQSYNDLWFLGWAAVIAMASKYILAIRGKHIFNPVALAVTLTYFTIDQSASWWVGDRQLLPYVVVGGLLIVMKIRRFGMVISFLMTALLAVLFVSLVNGTDLVTGIQRAILSSPLAFFGAVLLTEPLTMPPTYQKQLWYGALVGFFFTPLFQIGSFYTTPELALLIGNVYSYLVSPKTRLVLQLKAKYRIAPDIMEYVFGLPQRFRFVPGQYMEWTLGHADPDSRGNRRYFTLASAPSEPDLRLGVKFYPRSSSFKTALDALDSGQEIMASQLSGEFVLPKDPNQKCVFIAGGIGVTPFRSMLKYLLDTQQPRPILLFYANRKFEEIVYKDVFDRAEKELGIYTIYSVTDPTSLPPHWPGWVGRITPQWIAWAMPDYQAAIFYISGPSGMIHSMKDTLHQLGIPDSKIKVDFFAGLA